jgi:hypothetical protein
MIHAKVIHSAKRALKATRASLLSMVFSKSFPKAASAAMNTAIGTKNAIIALIATEELFTFPSFS